MKNSILKLSMLLLFVSLIQLVDAQVFITNDTTFNTQSQLFLANELFDSGEPFAEALGYDLEELDPMVPDSPDSLAYTLGIDNYEYSRYLLNTLSGRSGMGLHMMWSPVILQMAAMQPDSFDGMFTGGEANGYKEDDALMMTVQMFGAYANQQAPANPFPQFADFMSGTNTLPQSVAPDFQMDWGTTRWDRSKMQKVLSPGAMGMSMMKQYLWAKDMLGAFHDSANETIEADGIITPDSIDSPNFDPNNDVFYGGNNIDGFIGQMLTAAGINKTMHFINFLAFDGTNLGAVNPATYDPANGILYFPHQVEITESLVDPMLPPVKDAAMNVIDPSSHLFDQLSFLWATSGFKNMMDPTINDSEHYAYHEVFDGSPFPAAMSQTGVPGPFDLMAGTSMVIFKNLMAMHFNATAGTFVDLANLSDGSVVQNNVISAKEAGYVMVVLAQFAKEFAGTPLEVMANNAIEMQVAFVLNNFKDNENGGFFNSVSIGTGASTDSKTLAAQTALIRGLYAAYNHSENTSLLDEADAAYNYLINNFYSANDLTFRTEKGSDVAEYNPELLALVVGALREAKLTGNQTDADLVLMRFGKSTINKMLLSEAEQSGEDGSNSDNDGIPYIAGGNKPFVFADQATANLTITDLNDFNAPSLSSSVYPNPSNGYVHVEFNKAENVNQIWIQVFDITGKLVFSSGELALVSSRQSIPLNLTDLTKGIYFLRISDRINLLETTKIIIQ